MTYRITKDVVIAGAHRLPLKYKSKCTNVHGHNWRIRIACRAATLNDSGMIIDFAHIKKFLNDKLDHKMLNEVISVPTAENMARWVLETINAKWKCLERRAFCYRVDIEEAPGSVAIYEI